MKLSIKPYIKQNTTWPSEGKHILAQYDQDGIVVYQAYRPEIGKYAAKHQFFGGAFSYNRMTWIKPNFLWMMYRSGWASKPGQETILAIRLKRSYFDELLSTAVASNFQQSHLDSHSQWKANIADSDVRLQWDPDHDPSGKKQNRKAIQIGIRGQMLNPFKGDGILSIEDISDFVIEQSRSLASEGFNELWTPEENLYTPSCEKAQFNVGLDSAQPKVKHHE